MGHQPDRPPIPRAVIHKRILDAAADQPDAAMDALASDIPMATADLVENVLDEYGDPADDEPEDPLEPDASDSQMVNGSHSVDLDGLTETQRETLRAIAEHPDATQSEIADGLGVAAPTVCNRVNAIEGFAWADRQAFVEPLFNGDSTVQKAETDQNGPAEPIDGEREPTVQTEESDLMASNDTEPPTETGHEAAIDQLAERVATLEQEIEDFPDPPESVAVLNDPELTHKVVHACLKADTISENEELQMLKALLG